MRRVVFFLAIVAGCSSTFDIPDGGAIGICLPGEYHPCECTAADFDSGTTSGYRFCTGSGNGLGPCECFADGGE